MAEQITGMTMDNQVSSLSDSFGIYGYNQLYPTFPYGYDANYYYQQSYYHQMANASVTSYQHQSNQYQQVLPQNVKPSPGLWVPPKEANSTISNSNSEEPENNQAPVVNSTPTNVIVNPSIAPVIAN
jgi:hypothetical protein